ncbi:MAG: arylesterase [Bdellovibrionaceae bacterium]|nr:arylesterase [Pseudobdellovibrionaceae bacterium]
MLITLLIILNVSSADIVEADQRKQKSLVFLGDSLTEGYGVDQGSAYTSLIQKKMTTDKLQWKVINSGISGSTSASGPGRAKWLLKAKDKPDLVVVVLGANDGLRGLPVEAMKKSLNETVKTLQDAQIKVIIAELYVPPNYGKDYTENFKKVFSEVAKKNEIPLMPFLLEKVAGKADLNLADGIHPNEKGHQIIADGIYSFVKKYLK